MSFRRRLTIFFALIVVVPMIAVAIVLLQLSGDAREGKADTRLDANLASALRIYQGDVDAAREVARALASHPATVAGLEAGSRPQARRAAAGGLRRTGATAVVLSDAAGRELASAGSPDAVGLASTTLRRRGGALGSVGASTTSAESFVREVRDMTESDAALLRGAEALAETMPLGGTELPRSGNATVGGEEVRVRSAAIAGKEGELTLTVLTRLESKGLAGNEALIGIILAGFFALAVVFILPLLRDLDALHRQAAEQAVTDALTGLSNRRRFKELIHKEVDRARRFNHPLSLLLIDIDDFKVINDTHGHPKGDEVLRAVADVLRSGSREVDEPARYGGEEFALALPETSEEGAMEVAERLRARIEGLRVPLGRRGELSLTASIGVASIPAGAPTDADGLIGGADRALYSAKRAGKNRTERDVQGTPSAI